MEKLSFGETATLANDEEYTCFSRIEKDGKDYVFLMSNTEPVSVKIAEQNLVDDELTLTMVSDVETKKELLKIYKKSFAGSVERRMS